MGRVSKRTTKIAISYKKIYILYIFIAYLDNQTHLDHLRRFRHRGNNRIECYDSLVLFQYVHQTHGVQLDDIKNIYKHLGVYELRNAALVFFLPGKASTSQFIPLNPEGQ